MTGKVADTNMFIYLEIHACVHQNKVIELHSFVLQCCYYCSHVLFTVVVALVCNQILSKNCRKMGLH